MSNEFRPIEKAPLYEIDKEGNVRKIKKQTLILPYPLGSRVVNLNLDEKTRKPFNVDVLVEEIFGEKKLKSQVVSFDEPIVVDEIELEKSERSKDTEQMPSSGKITATKKEKKEKKVKVVKEVKVKKEKKEKDDTKGISFREKIALKNKVKKQEIISGNVDIANIMNLKCTDSIRMWKLHKLGIKNDVITILVDRPHDFVVVHTIKKYKNNRTLQERADKIDV